MGRYSLIRPAAFSAFVAVITLLGMAFLPRPFLPVDHLAILSGGQQLSGEQFSAYRAYVVNNLTLDSAYLLAHAVFWLGLAQLAARQSASLGRLALFFGLSGAVLDFLENEIRWVAMNSLSAGDFPTQCLLVIWQIVFAFSFWFLFLGAACAGLACYRLSRWGQIFAAFTLLGMPAAVAVYRQGHFPAFIWLILWHAQGGILLWSARQYGGEIGHD